MGNRKILCRIVILLLSGFLFSCAGSLPNLPKKEKALAYQRLGNSLYIQGNARDALVQLLEAEKLDNRNPDLQHDLALVYQKLDQFDLSLRHFKRAIDLRPDFPDAYNNMGTLYSQKMDWDNAMKCFEKAVSNILYRTPHFAYHNMGLVYFHQNNYQKAIEFYQKAISLSPEYEPAYFDLAKAYELIEQNDNAFDTYKKIIDIVPDSLTSYLAMARLYYKTGQKDKAISNINFIIGTDPRSQIAREAMKLLEEIQSR
jgi:type IV pilus biogenesis/stability protein PilW